MGPCSTYSGLLFDARAPFADDFRVVDVAHQLALQCRWGGACRVFYSVAEHSLAVMEVIRGAAGSDVEQLHGLLHDAGEAYLGDVPTPRKTVDQIETEQAVLRAFYLAIGFGLPNKGQRQFVADADLHVAAVEANGLLAAPPRGLAFPKHLKREAITAPMSWSLARMEWLRAFVYLAGRCGVVERFPAWTGVVQCLEGAW